MRLTDLELLSGRPEWTRRVAPVSDERGAQDYEVIVAGPGDVVERTLAEADFDLTIDPRSAPEESERELEASRREELEAIRELLALEDPRQLFKQPPDAPSPETGVFISVRRVRGDGTRFGPFVLRNFSLARPFSLFFFLPPVCVATGRVQPASGDQDLFLFAATFPFNFFSLRSSSVRGGTLVDVVSHSIGPLQGCNIMTVFVPVFQVFGFDTGVCAEFRFSGAN